MMVLLICIMLSLTAPIWMQAIRQAHANLLPDATQLPHSHGVRILKGLKLNILILLLHSAIPAGKMNLLPVSSWLCRSQ